MQLVVLETLVTQTSITPTQLSGKTSWHLGNFVSRVTGLHAGALRTL